MIVVLLLLVVTGLSAVFGCVFGASYLAGVVGLFLGLVMVVGWLVGLSILVIVGGFVVINVSSFVEYDIVEIVVVVEGEFGRLFIFLIEGLFFLAGLFGSVELELILVCFWCFLFALVFAIILLLIVPMVILLFFNHRLAGQEHIATGL